MARLISPLQFTGKLDGLSFYRMKGVEGIVVRQAYGPDRKRIRRDPRYRRLRENNSEFACAVMAGKEIRKAFAPFRRFAGSWFHSRLTGLLVKAIRQSPEGERGKRTLDISRAARLLEGFQWNPRNPLPAITPIMPDPGYIPGLPCSLHASQNPKPPSTRFLPLPPSACSLPPAS